MFVRKRTKEFNLKLCSYFTCERSIILQKHILISFRCPPQHYVSLNAPLMRQNEQRFKTQTDYLNMAASPDYNQVATQDVSDEKVWLIYYTLEII